MANEDDTAAVPAGDCVASGPEGGVEDLSRSDLGLPDDGRSRGCPREDLRRRRIRNVTTRSASPPAMNASGKEVTPSRTTTTTRTLRFAEATHASRGSSSECPARHTLQQLDRTRHGVSRACRPSTADSPRPALATQTKSGRYRGGTLGMGPGRSGTDRARRSLDLRSTSPAPHRPRRAPLHGDSHAQGQFTRLTSRMDVPDGIRNRSWTCRTRPEDRGATAAVPLGRHGLYRHLTPTVGASGRTVLRLRSEPHSVALDRGRTTW